MFTVTVDQCYGVVCLIASLPGRRAVVDRAGWRAEVAVYVGPLTKENSLQIARFVLIASQQGLPQVEESLR